MLYRQTNGVGFRKAKTLSSASQGEGAYYCVPTSVLCFARSKATRE